MKRDMDVIREIVLAVADTKLGDPVNRIDGVEPEIFAAHAQLLVEAGLVTAALQGAGRNGTDIPMQHAKAAIIYRLTWDGQDFASSIRNEKLWNKVVKNVVGPTTSWTFDIVKEYLKAEIKEGLPRLGL